MQNFLIKLRVVWYLLWSNEYVVVCSKGRYSSVGILTAVYFWWFVKDSVRLLKKADAEQRAKRKQWN